MFYGADTEAVRSCSDAMHREGGRVQDLGLSLLRVLESVTWVGADAESLRDRGREVLGQQMTALADRIRAAGEELTAHAEEQDSASDGDAAGPGAPPQDDNAFWFWQDGWSAPFSDRADILDDIPLDEEQFGIEAMGQEGFPNCVTVASLGALAESDPEFFADRVRRIDDEHYEVELFIDGQWKTVTVKDDVHQSGSRDDGRQNWLTLYEQALIQEGVLNEDGSYANQNAVQVYEAVTGAEGTRHVGRPGQYRGVEPALTFDDAVAAYQNGQAVILGTSDHTAVSSDGSLHLAENHAYAIESVNPDGTITIVNPWGEDARFGGEDGEYRTTLTREQFNGLFNDSHTGPPPEDWDRSGGR